MTCERWYPSSRAPYARHPEPPTPVIPSPSIGHSVPTRPSFRAPYSRHSERSEESAVALPSRDVVKKKILRRPPTLQDSSG